MQQQMVELERIHFSRVFPWVHLFKSFRLALDVRKMILGAAALLLISGGMAAFSYMPLDLTKAETDELRKPLWESEPPIESRFELPTELELTDSATLLIRPALAIWQPAAELVETPMNWSGAALRWTQILWALCVWSFFGTAISRMTAVQFAVDQRVTLKETAGFAGGKWLWAISAPLMPLAGVLGLWFGCVVFGWIGRIPGVGPVFLGLFWIVPLLLAFGMVLLLIGMVLGWPLMVATIAVQGSDAFDGFSRSFDYVYSRFWRLVWFLVVTLFHGILMLALVFLAFHAIRSLAGTAALAGAGVSNSTGFANRAVAVWDQAILLLLFGYAVSYFWSASTIIYFLLRQSEDANRLNEVYLPKEDSSGDLVQLAGVAASDQPVIERPAKHSSETRQPGTETDMLDDPEPKRERDA